MKETTIESVDIDSLQPNPFQPRNRIKQEDIQELAASIKQFGILEPLVVAETPAGLQIIAGERRWRAAKQAGLKQVPIILKNTTPREMLEMALIENVQRTDLNALERAKAFEQLRRDFGHSRQDIADRISKSISFVNNTLRLLTLPDALKDGIAGGLITEGHARALQGLGDDEIPTMIKLYKQILVEDGSVRRAEELVRNHKSDHGTSPLSKPRGPVTRHEDPEFKEWQQRLQKVLRRRSDAVKVQLVRSLKQTRIVITIKGDLDKTQPALQKIMELTSQDPDMKNSMEDEVKIKELV